MRCGAGRLWAIVLTLALHALVLAYVAFKPIAGPEASPDFVEVVWADESMDLPQPVHQTMEQILAQRIAERVANVQADQRAAASDEVRSTRQASEQLAAEVEAELRAFEADEAARLAAEEKEFGIEAVPDVERGNVETYEGWDKRYSGEVTASFDCPGRSARHLDVPGYRCEGGGVVVVKVEVNRDGEVLETAIGNPSAMECLAAEALRSAARSRFNIDPSAERVATCTIRYVFVPQSQ